MSMDYVRRTYGVPDHAGDSRYRAAAKADESGRREVPVLTRRRHP